MSDKERILIIDDDAVTLRLAGHIFEKHGYEVHTAKDGRQGLAKVNEIKPDLVILDVMMPDMSGLEVCERLRSDPATAWLPIIMLSAKSGVDDKLEGFDAGADDYVAKPVSHKELLARANALLQRARRVQPAKARVIAVVGVKGGVGVTTVAVNVAMLLTCKEKSVILAELRSQRGTVGQNLNLSPAGNLGSLLRLGAAEIRPMDVKRCIVQHKSGMRVLIGPQSSENYVLTEAHAHTILETLLDQAEYLVLDLPAVVEGGVQLALEQADQILLVMEPEAVSISCAQSDIEALKAWGLLNRTGVMIVSRARSSNLIAPRDIEKELGVEVVGVLPPSPEVFYLAGKLGNPAVISKPDTLPVETLVELTDTMLERLPTTPVSMGLPVSH